MAVRGELFLEAYIKAAAFLSQSLQAAQAERRQTTSVSPSAAEEAAAERWKYWSECLEIFTWGSETAETDPGGKMLPPCFSFVRFYSLTAETPPCGLHVVESAERRGRQSPTWSSHLFTLTDSIHREIILQKLNSKLPHGDPQKLLETLKDDKVAPKPKRI